MARELLNGRYRPRRAIGAGGFGHTQVAWDELTQREVVLKELDLRRAADWKSIELFEREAQVLQGLDHPGIPAYVDDFREEEGGDTRFFLVQELAPGETLHDRVVNGWRPDTQDVLAIAEKLLEILVYLQDLHPPVVHRDIKPQNVLLDDAGTASLVDFGSVKASIGDGTGGSTVAGTFGYMAPEQLRGVGLPGTDVFGLGMTLLFVLTGEDPSKLPVRGLKVAFRDVIELPPDLASWLERCTEPDHEQRFDSARDALAALRANAGAESRGVFDAPLPEVPTVTEDDDGEEASPEELERWVTPDNDARWKEVTGMGGVGMVGFASMILLSLVSIALGSAVTPVGLLLGAPLVGTLILWLLLYTGATPSVVIQHPRSLRDSSRGTVVAALIMWLSLLGFYGASVGIMLDPGMVLNAVGLGFTSTAIAAGIQGYLRQREVIKLHEKTGIEWPLSHGGANPRPLRVRNSMPGRYIEMGATPKRGWLYPMAWALTMFVADQVAHAQGADSGYGWSIAAAILMVLAVMGVIKNRDEQRKWHVVEERSGSLFIRQTTQTSESARRIASIRVSTSAARSEKDKSDTTSGERVEIYSVRGGAPVVEWFDSFDDAPSAEAMMRGLETTFVQYFPGAMLRDPDARHQEAQIGRDIEDALEEGLDSVIDELERELGDVEELESVEENEFSLEEL